MKQYKVEITREALQDMEDIYNSIAVDLLTTESKYLVDCFRTNVEIRSYA